MKIEPINYLSFRDLAPASAVCRPGAATARHHGRVPTIVFVHAHPDDEASQTSGCDGTRGGRGPPGRHRLRHQRRPRRAARGRPPDGETLVHWRRREAQAVGDGARGATDRLAGLRRLGHDRLGAEPPRRRVPPVPTSTRRRAGSRRSSTRRTPTSSWATTGTAATATPTTSRSTPSSTGRRARRAATTVLESTFNRDVIAAHLRGGGRGGRPETDARPRQPRWTTATRSAPPRPRSTCRST